MSQRVITVAFICRDGAACDSLWSDIRDRYGFCGDDVLPVQASAVAAGDLFGKIEAVEQILESDLCGFEQSEAISDIVGHTDWQSKLHEWLPEDASVGEHAQREDSPESEAEARRAADAVPAGEQADAQPLTSE